ncbi:MAG: choice-of-anchor L domain-containing protein, partial [Nannocystaceae bacterium]
VIAEEFSHEGSLDSIAVLHGGLAGPDSTFLPQEGARSVVLSTGHAGSFLKPREQLNDEELCTSGDTLCPSHDHLRSTDSFLPPVNPTPVGEETCQQNPSLIGQGDCSNTIEDQWALGGSDFVFDYTQLQLVVQVPPLVDALVFDYAFFTAEYPTRYRDGFNDMFLVWAETESWTGNVALDYESRPVTASATRFDYRDSVVPDDCPEPCVAEELHETSMRGHAATNWRSTEIELSPGEEVTLIFGLFDVGDGLTDSAVLLDNVRWNCAIPE